MKATLRAKGIAAQSALRTQRFNWAATCPSNSSISSLLLRSNGSTPNTPLLLLKYWDFSINPARDSRRRSAPALHTVFLQKDLSDLTLSSYSRMDFCNRVSPKLLIITNVEEIYPGLNSRKLLIEGNKKRDQFFS
jgi:hypothetical protein